VGISEEIYSINEVLKVLKHEINGNLEDLYDMEARPGAGGGGGLGGLGLKALVAGV